ncbi:MAG TPA: hypothetical protein VN112_18780 [Ensifer sp.]|nr:hypothetical protein [Ensifer sp.]
MADDTRPRDQALDVERDARGQFAPKQAGGKNNGVADAKPRVINKSEDATIHNRPPEPDAGAKPTSGGGHRGS